jgi:molybdopterin converting factor small subunit
MDAPPLCAPADCVTTCAVHLFAGVKAEFGATVDVPLLVAGRAVPTAAILAAVETTLRARLTPSRASTFSLRGCVVSVDLTVLTPEDPDAVVLTRSTEVAVLPPVSGG